jgi:Mce-associated membrane protein
MAKATEPVLDTPTASPTSRAGVLALVEEAEAEAAEAEALAAAARARVRAARLRREAQALTEAAEIQEAAEAAEVEEAAEAAEVTEVHEAAETVEAETAAADEGVETAEAETPAADESAETAEDETELERVQRRWLRRPTLSTIAQAAAILLILGFTGLSGFFAWQHHESTQRAHRFAAFEAGARQGVINITSLDFKRAKQDVQRVIDSSTGEFRDDFQQRAADFAKVVEKSKVVTEGTVNAAAVESMDDHSAVVLISATSRITNAAGAKDEPRAWRLRVTVTEEGGQYKMSKVEFVP